MNKLAAVTALAGAMMIAPAAHADHKDKRKGPPSDWDYAEVVSSRPIYREVRVAEPREECWDERVVRRERRGYGPSAGAITGAIVGGVIGHQFGNGRGKDAATVAGAILGAGIGEQAGYENRRVAERVSYETQCRTVHDVRYEERIDGYDVAYRYGGRVYRTRMPYDPGDRIRVRVDEYFPIRK